MAKWQNSGEGGREEREEGPRPDQHSKMMKEGEEREEWRADGVGGRRPDDGLCGAGWCAVMSKPGLYAIWVEGEGEGGRGEDDEDDED